MRVPGLGGWADDPLWGSVYDWTVEHRRLGRLLWAVGAHTDLELLYDAAGEIGRQPAGARILDVPSGGGVAVRALRPGQRTAYVAADISARMLERTIRVAAEHGVADQVTTRVADVGELPFADGAFDLVVTFTGLHCFPDPHRAVVELTRVLAPGGVLTGSALMTDTGLRFQPARMGGRAAGLLGPGCSRSEVRRWFAEGGLGDVTMRTSGPLAYFRAARPGRGGRRPLRSPRPIQAPGSRRTRGMAKDWNGIWITIEGTVHGWLMRHSIDALRIAMGVVFLGFGVLKFFPGVSPAENLVEATIAKMTDGLVPPEVGLLITAVLECAIGISMILRRYLRLTVYLLIGELLGILSPVVLLPGRLFAGPGHMPTLEGQYVLKDVILAAAAMVVATQFRGARITADSHWVPPHVVPVEATPGRETTAA